MNDCSSVIVTGATGFVGGHLLRRLLADGVMVYAISRTAEQASQHENLTWVTWQTYSDKISVDQRLDAVFHLATSYGNGGESRSEVLCANTTQPIELFAYAKKRGANLIINADSFFGKPRYQYQHLRNYIESKALLVEKAKILIEDTNISFVNLRLEHVFGANDNERKFVPNYIKRLVNENDRIKLTDGLQKRDFIYVDDVVNAFLVVFSEHSRIGFTEYEVGTGRSTELKKFCIMLAELAGTSISRLDFGAIPQRPNEIMDSAADISSLSSLGWSPLWDLPSALSDLMRGDSMSRSMRIS